MSGTAAPFTFFAILRDGTPRRIRLLNDAAVPLTAEFTEQRAAFLPQGFVRVPYQPFYRPEEDDVDEVIEIKQFDLQAVGESVTNAQSVPDLTPDDLHKGSVCGMVASNLTASLAHATLLFQMFDQRQRIEPRRALFATAETFVRPKEEGLVIGSHLAAVWEKGSLLFRSEGAVKRFLDLSQVFQEATDQDIDVFAANGRLKADSILLKSVCSSWYRRRITAIMASRIIEDVGPKELMKAAKGFGIELECSGQGKQAKLVVPTGKDELKQFLRFLNEDYYQSPVRDLKFRSSSKVQLS